MTEVWRVPQMLNRRKLIQTTIAGGLLGPQLVHAQRPLGGVMSIQQSFRFVDQYTCVQCTFLSLF